MMNDRRLRTLLKSFVLVSMVIAISYGVWATQVTVTTIKGPYPGTVSANDLDVTLTAAHATDATFTITGKEILIAVNLNAATKEISLYSVADNYGRKADITTYSIGPDEMVAFKFSNTVGWATSDQIVHASGTSTDIKLGLIRY